MGFPKKYFTNVKLCFRKCFPKNIKIILENIFHNIKLKCFLRNMFPKSRFQKIYFKSHLITNTKAF